MFSAYYAQKYGEGNPAGDSFHGTHAEPHVNQLIFQEMLDRYPQIHVRLKHRLKSVEVKETENRKKISSILVENRQQELILISGKVFIDASYEGDLLAEAGVDYHVGRESREKYGESLAAEQEDREVQGYNFRLIMTQNPDNKVPAFRPENYRREDYLPLLKLFEKGEIKTVFCAPKEGIYKYQPLLCREASTTLMMCREVLSVCRFRKSARTGLKGMNRLEKNCIKNMFNIRSECCISCRQMKRFLKKFEQKPIPGGFVVTNLQSINIFLNSFMFEKDDE